MLDKIDRKLLALLQQDCTLSLQALAEAVNLTTTPCWKRLKRLEDDGIPNTFVPGRNILFLTLAAIYAYQVKAEAVITGVCETDFSGYPDCRDEFVKALNHAVSLGMAKDIRFETPLMWIDKAETWALADYYGKLDLVRNETLTCYNGFKGDGCGHCAACNLRANGLNHYLADKPTVMAAMKQKTGLR